MKLISAKITDNHWFLPGIRRPNARTITNSQIMWLRCPEISREAKPGQFVMVRCGGGCTLPRPFSIHQIDKEEDMALFFAVWEDGKGTNWLSERHKDETVELFGPLGNGFSIQPASKKLLLVAGGMGIAPLCFLAQEASRRECSVILLYGTANKHHYPKDRLPPGIELVTTTEDGTVGKKGRVTDLLPDFTNWADQIFACGPMIMYRDMVIQKQKLNLEGKPVQISLEVRMGCGLGICYGCTIKTKGGLKKVCADGPIFDLDDILWDELI